MNATCAAFANALARAASMTGLLGILACAPNAFASSEPAPLAAIPSLELSRYAGRWYEIAKYPNRFQRQCVADTTAEYRLQPEGGVEVVNRCRTGEHSFDEAVGAARLVGGPGSAKLKVRFAPAWLSFLDAVWGDYWVVDVAPATNSRRSASRSGNICGCCRALRRSTRRAMPRCWSACAPWVSTRRGW